MSKSIWHTKNEKATEGKTVFAQHKTFRDGGIECFMWEKQEFTDAIRKDVIAWCYLDDLLALETGNKDLSDKIGKLETELERTRKALKIAVDALNAGKTLADIAGFKMLVAGLEEALAKITALEQKD